MVPHFTFEIKPFVARQQDAESDDLADHHFTNRIEIATPFGKIGDAGRVAFVFALPNRIKPHAQPGFRSSFIHGPQAIIDFLVKRAKKNLKPQLTAAILRVASLIHNGFTLQAADAESSGNDLERGRKSSWKFAVDFQIYLHVAFGGPHRHLSR